MNKTRRIIFFSKTILILLLLSACMPSSNDTVVATSSESDDGNIEFDGLDVSHFQGDVDWPSVAAAGKRFAITKATEGISYIDPNFTQNWQQIEQVNITRGAYHFFVPNDDAAKQAQHFIASVTLEPGDLPPILDIEEAQGEATGKLQSQIKVWLQTVEAHYGIKPIIYSDYSFLNTYLKDGFCDYPLWMADYSSTPPEGVGCWPHWTILQFTDSGKVNGINGNVDLDRFVGTRQKWSSLLVK